MRSIVPIEVFKPFDAETVTAMGEAFDAAIVLVEEKTGHAATALMRELVALRIVETALRGIHDRESLRDDAVSYAERSRLGTTQGD